MLDPAKWRVLGARAQAWLVALGDAGLAVVEAGASARWRVQPGTVITRTRVVAPLAVGALPLVIADSRLGLVDGDDAGVTLGVGDPAEFVGAFPDCGCDACDSGSQDALDELDRHVLGVVTGAFRRLSKGTRTIMVIDGDGWSASGWFSRNEVEVILTDATGWHELSGASWLGRT